MDLEKVDDNSDNRQYVNHTVVNKQQLPNASTVLVMGILSLVLSCGIGLILAIIGLNLSKEGVRLWQEDQMGWDGYGSLNAGRVMCIIGLCLNGLVALYFLVIFLFVGSIFGTFASFLGTI